MIKTILVPATASETDGAVFEAALSVARMFSAHLDFLHVRVDPVQAIAAMGSGDIGGTMAAASLLDGWIAEAVQREERAEGQFRSFCERAGVAITQTPPGPADVSAEWHREIGREPVWLVEYAQACDLIAIARPIDGEGISTGTLAAALLETGRPLLITGTGPMQAPAENVAIAWKPTAEAARAVSAAMPFLAKSKIITILTVEEKDRRGEESAVKLAATLRWHGLTVNVRHLDPGEGSTANTLLTAADQMGIGLLVMGGYGHSRFQEFVFGGFTVEVLRGVTLPVLMAH
jgi:nucleotide-binding universal stress UspA family protein